MNEYDIGEAFSKIENELISSMIRNMDKHRAEETQYGYEWSMWQTEQLKALERYKRANLKKYPNRFKNINEQITALIQTAHDTGSMKQEEAILKAIKNGFKGFKKPAKGINGEFFKLNERKLEALIEATINDMERAETAILRMSNDKYRSAIYDAQVFYNTGAGTYEKALDMATKTMLSAGLNCIEYKNGSRHRLKEYAGMALRTASTRAYLYGEGQMRQKWGVHTVIVAKRTNPCPKCLPFVGKIMIDDVWSGGSARDGPYPLISAAIAAGLYHPNCKDIHTTYFPGISEPPDDTWTEAELKDIEQFNKDEAKHQYVSRQVEKFGRLEKYSLDKENKKIYGVRRKEWEAKYRNDKDLVDKKFKSSNIKNIELPPDIMDIRGMSEDTKKAISNAFDVISSEYNIIINKCIVKSLGKGNDIVPLQFQALNVGGYYESAIIINRDYCFNDFEERIMKNFNSGALASKNIEDVIAHEIAHIMTFQQCETYGQFVAAEDEVRELFKRGMSRYADSTYDGAETIAEAFVRYRRGEKLPDNIMELLKKYILRWKK